MHPVGGAHPASGDLMDFEWLSHHATALQVEGKHY
jgi:hypothetical protein